MSRQDYMDRWEDRKEEAEGVMPPRIFRAIERKSHINPIVEEINLDYVKYSDYRALDNKYDKLRAKYKALEDQHKEMVLRYNTAPRYIEEDVVFHIPHND